MSAIVKSVCVCFAILVSFATLFAVTDALTFNVGGDGVWSINPKENYNTWAERNRFQVNDTLYFKYAKGSDSVQQVMKADYDYCNTNNPLKKFDDGESIYKFDRSGPFYFISGNEDHCKKGQKLIVVVLAIRNHPNVPISPAKPPSMAQPPKSPPPVSPIAPAHPPSTAQPPKSNVAPVSPPSKSPQAPSPVSHSPAHSPSQSPSPLSQTPAQAPTQSPLTPSPSPAFSPSQSPISPSPSPVSQTPAQAPTLSPWTPSPSPATSPSPSSSSSDQSPTSSPADQTSTSSPSPSEANTSSDTATAPAPSSRNSASCMAVTSVMTAVLGLAFTVLLFV